MTRTPIGRTGALKPARTRKCAVKGCSNRFQPRKMMHKVCGPDCSTVFAVAERQRLDTKQTHEAKAKFKNRTEHLADVQAVFNR
jgi:hypothetical protein